MNAVHSIFPRPVYPEGYLGTALVIDRDDEETAAFVSRLGGFGYEVFALADQQYAIEWFSNNSIDIVFIAARYIDDTDPGLLAKIKSHINDTYVPVVVTCRPGHGHSEAEYIDAGADDCFVVSLAENIIIRRIELLKQLREMHTLYRLSVHEQEIGKKIHTAAISTRILDIHPIRTINRSAAVFSGDLILLAQKPGGNIHVMLADFTGHGLSAAIGALPVADTFCVMTEKGFKPEVIIRQINRKLYTLLPTSMFMSMVLVQINPDLDHVSIWNAGMPHVYQLDAGTGLIKRTISSSSIPLGVIEHIDDQFSPVQVDVRPGDTFILHSDGLTEYMNSGGEMFGVERLESILNQSAQVENVFDEILREFDGYCDTQELGDDVSLVSVPCVKELFESSKPVRELPTHVKHAHSGNWKWSMELSGASMYDVDPVPMIVREYSKLLNQPVEVMDLHNVLSELYKNALEHGVFRDARKKVEREHRTNRDDETNTNLLDGCYIRVELELLKHDGRPALCLRVDDSGRGFDYDSVMSRIEGDCNDISAGYGLSLANTICESLQFSGKGNSVEAIMAGAS